MSITKIKRLKLFREINGMFWKSQKYEDVRADISKAKAGDIYSYHGI